MSNHSSAGVKTRPTKTTASRLRASSAPSGAAPLNSASPAKVVPLSAPTPIKISDTTIHRFTDVFKMLADSNRLKILLALAQDGRMHVTALCDMLGQSQPAVSHHLTLMRMVGLVGFDRVGKNNFYYLASDHIRELLEQFFADAGNSQKVLQFEGFNLAFRGK